MIVTLTRDIAMSRGTHNATCYTQGLDMWHFYFFFQKFKKNLKFFKKIKKKPQTNTWHVD